MPMEQSNNYKEIATRFLQLITAGDIDKAYEELVSPAGKHHNLFFAAGFPALKTAMKENHLKFPNKQFTIKHVFEDGEFVAVHSRVILEPGGAEHITVHVFRFENGRIVEMWDCSQEIPADSSNVDGAF